MNRHDFRRRLETAPLWLDGAIGTELARRGLPPGAPPEAWCLDHPDVLAGIHRDYAQAGSDILYAATFGANRAKLSDHGLGGDVDDINQRLVALARHAAPDALVFGDLAPTGRLLEPAGDCPFEEVVDIYREQAAALDRAGVHGFVVETMLDIQEARAALLGIRAVRTDAPVLVSLTYDPDGRTLSGTPPAAAIVTLQALGADAVGCNCSAGPDDLFPLLRAMLPFARVPLLAKPNAGIPVLDTDGRAEYRITPTAFADATLAYLRLGVRLVGGCCGTTPDHIRAARAAAATLPAGDLPPPPFAAPARGLAAVSSSQRVYSFPAPGAGGGPVAVVGERINPTGKKKFQAELLAGSLEGVRRFADQQLNDGADLLDVNVGLAGLDEPAALRAATALLASAVPAPLSLDTANPEALEAALRIYPGRALVNSVSAEPERLEKLLPVAARHGAMLLLLPVDAQGVPADADTRFHVARALLATVAPHGYGPDDVLMDGLAMAVSADPHAGRHTLDFLDRCARELGLRTILGLSNVSFGLPGRSWVNATFLAMAMARGLTAVIANPGEDALRLLRTAADALLGRDAGMGRLVRHFGALDAEKKARASIPAPQPSTEGAPPRRPGNTPEAAAAETTAAEKAGGAVLRGELAAAARWTRTALEEGVPATRLVSDHLVPAITRAGQFFETKKFYLPQLMLAGEAMRRAMEIAEPALARERGPDAAHPRRGRVVMATVAGDVHDIGKNLVILMLRNHGYIVIDLGKDVPPDAIVRAALEHDADLVGLSALMTTTLPGMRAAVAALRENGARAKIMIGGAAATAAHAENIGADGYAPDAVEAVRLADRLLSAVSRL